MNSQALALAISQINAVVGITVRFAARSWQMQVGQRWVVVLPDTAQICNDIYADCLAQVQAAQAARKAVNSSNTGPGRTKGGPAGKGGAPGVSSRLRISRHPGLSLGIPGVRLRLGARPGLMLSPEAADGPAGTAMVYGATIVGLIGVISASLYKASQAAIKYSRDVAELRAQTGGSLGRASEAIQSGRTFGIPLSGLSSENRLVQSRLSMLYGGNGSGDLSDIIAFRNFARGQIAQGPVGEYFAQRMAARTNRTGYLDAAYMPDAEFASQIARSRKLQRALGQSPADLENNAYRMNNIRSIMDQGLAMLADRFGAAFTRKFGPLLDKGLDVLVNHSGAVGKEIDKAMDVGFSAVKAVAHWVYVGLPQAFHRGEKAVLEFLLNLSTGFDAFSAGFMAFRNSPVGKLMFGAAGAAAKAISGEEPTVLGALKVVNTAISPYGLLKSGLEGAVDAGGVGPGGVNTPHPAAAAAARAAGRHHGTRRHASHMGLDFGLDSLLNPILNRGIENLKEGANWAFRHPFTKERDMIEQRRTEINLARQANMVPGDVRARYLRGQGPAPRWVNPNAELDANGVPVSGGMGGGDGSSGGLTRWLASALAGVDASIKDDEGREGTWQKIAKLLESIDGNTKDTADSLKAGQGSGMSYSDVRARMLQDLAEDTSLAWSR